MSLRNHGRILEVQRHISLFLITHKASKKMSSHYRTLIDFMLLQAWTKHFFFLYTNQLMLFVYRYLCDNHAHYYYYLSLLYNARVSMHCTTIAILDKSTRSTSEQKQALVTRFVRRNNPSKCKYYYRASDSDDMKRVDDVNLYKVINCWMSFGLK